MMQDSVKITFKVKPRARTTGIVRIDSDVIHLRVHAPPEKGAANSEIISFLSSLLQIPKNQISIRSGLTSSLKIIEISGLNHQEFIKRISPP